MPKIIVSLSSDEPSTLPQPALALGSRTQHRAVVLPKVAYEWFALLKKHRGENIITVKGLADWMFKKGESDEQLADALTELLKIEIERMRKLKGGSATPARSNTVKLLERFFTLSAKLQINNLIRPEGAVAQALADGEVNYFKLYDFIDGLRSYLLFQLTSLAESESGQLQLPLTELLQTDQDADVA
jgi:hypothetical protein